MGLQAGKTQYAGSMAEAMEKAFKAQMDKGMPKSDEQMKTLFIAVAEGVIQHLVANADAFQINLSMPSGESFSGSFSVEIINDNQ